MAERRKNSNRATGRTADTKVKKKLTKKEQQKRKLIIFGVEILALLILLVVLAVVNLVGKIDFNKLENAGINDDLSEETLSTLDGYTNIAIFGLDNRDNGNYSGGQSDTIMIVSVNDETKDVKIISVYRDSYLRVGDEKYGKANSAYTRGGAEQAVQMLNANLDLNITDYVCVDWAALVEAIDELGGIEIEITAQEAQQINNYMWEIDQMMGTRTPQVSGSGLKTLSGVQATAYARIRNTAGDDFKRTSRQRIILGAMLDKAKQSDVGTLIDICNVVFDDISTTLELSEIIDLAKDVAKYNIVSTSGFPFAMTTEMISGSGDSVVPISLENNVSQLHLYLFGTEGYVPSETVQGISDTIIEKSGVTADEEPLNVDSYNDTAGQNGTDFH